MNEYQPTHLDLFTGIGGFTLAFEAEGFRTIGFSEINEDKLLVLKHWWPHIPNLGDLTGINGSELSAAHGGIDVITGGVPCQPASALGQMRGSADERWLWPQTIGVVRAVRPRYGVFENPPSILGLESGRAWNGIVSALAARGYDCWWDVFPAAAFGAGHLRERVLLVIRDANGIAESEKRRIPKWPCAESEGNCETDSNSMRERWERRQGTETRTVNHGQNAGWIESNGGTTRFCENEVASNTNSIHRRNRTGRQDGSETDNGSLTPAPHADRAGLQGHAEHGADGQGRPGTRRPITPPDLRGRVNCAEWWHEINTGIPVLADGLPARLVEAAARCAGDSVVPQVIQPIARAIYQQIQEERMRLVTSSPTT